MSSSPLYQARKGAPSPLKNTSPHHSSRSLSVVHEEGKKQSLAEASSTRSSSASSLETPEISRLTLEEEKPHSDARDDKANPTGTFRFKPEEYRRKSQDLRDCGASYSDWTAFFPSTPAQPSPAHTADTPRTPMTFSPFSPKTPHYLQTPFTPQSHFAPFDLTEDPKEGFETQKFQSRAVNNSAVATSADLVWHTRTREKAQARGEEGVQDLGRYLVISNMPRNITHEQLLASVGELANIKALIVRDLHKKGSMILAFFDPRETLRLYNYVHDNPITFYPGGPAIQLQCMRIEREVVEQAAERGEEWNQVWNDSDDTLVVELEGGKGVTESDMKFCLERWGGELQYIEMIGQDGRIFKAQFYDTRHATEAVKKAHNSLYKSGARAKAYLQKPDVFGTVQNTNPGRLSYSRGGSTLGSAAYSHGGLNISLDGSSSSFPQPIGSGINNRRSVCSIDSSLPTATETPRSDLRRRTFPLQSSYRTDSPHYLEPFGPGTYRHDAPPHLTSMARRMEIGEGGAVESIVDRMDISARVRRGQGLPYRNPYDRQAIPEENRVIPERITSGLDRRTTVMIKDVPADQNKLSRQELVDILDEASRAMQRLRGSCHAQVVPKEYDFVYLRFDFKNCCNVGYAFVNFTNVKALYRLIQAKAGRKWNLFSSEKVLQLSYANIQGKYALINKFKNSAVMDVIEAWRPQIFYSSGSMRGQPEPFPESDDIRLKQRSAAARFSSLSHSSLQYGYDDSSSYDYASSGYDQSHRF
ncbi:hypothetical protein P7C73_g1882, partial [Tremellales sp. Uapishka_1]